VIKREKLSEENIGSELVAGVLEVLSKLDSPHCSLQSGHNGAPLFLWAACSSGIWILVGILQCSGTEYIFMQFAPGIKLNGLWQDPEELDTMSTSL
jgi:hypothetical protein